MNTHIHLAAHDPLIGVHEVMRISSLSRSSIHRAMKSGRFPQSIQVTAGGRVAWRQSEVLAWAAEPMAWGAEAGF